MSKAYIYSPGNIFTETSDVGDWWLYVATNDQNLYVFISLSDYKTHITNYFPKYCVGPCKQLSPELRKMIRSYEKERPIVDSLVKIQKQKLSELEQKVFDIVSGFAMAKGCI